MSNVSGIIKSIQDIMRKDVGVDGDAQRISQLVWMFFLKIFDDREAERLEHGGLHEGAAPVGDKTVEFTTHDPINVGHPAHLAIEVVLVHQQQDFGQNVPLVVFHF